MAPNLELTHTSTAEKTITPGELYKFKVLARNSVGESLLSPETTIKAATVPSAPDKPTLLTQ